jgi:DNA repair protein RecO (recombination protein O)
MFKTRSIILRTVKYGETSLVVTAFTELFGAQTYMVNGIRSSKKTGIKAAMYQPAALLDMMVYHNERNTMHRIKECNWAFLYQNILTDVVKNSIAMFMMELIYKLLKQPEENTDLFYFCEDALITLDKCSSKTAANYPLFFTLHLSHFFGFKIDDNFSEDNKILDLQEGNFTNIQPPHSYYLDEENAFITSEILKAQLPEELSEIKMNHLRRRELLLKYVDFYTLHLPEFGKMKTLPILQEILG